jgi:DNA-binding transcriptional LysR family regulator
MDRLQSMRAFAQVVDEGGFAAAARKLDLAPAVVTRLVVDLEQHLGVRLLHRTTRRLSLTQAGQAYLVRLRAILSEIDEAQAMVQAESREMTGTVRLLATPVVASHILAPLVAGFQRAHPAVLLDIHVEDSPHPAVEDYDLTLLGSNVQIDADVIVRTVILSQAVYCASPEYLQRYGVPESPQQMQQHRWLALAMPGARRGAMTLINPAEGDRTTQVQTAPVLTANHTDTLLRATLAGAGISSHPLELVAPWLKSGELVRVLAPWISSRLRLFAVLPSRKFVPARTRAFLEFLVDATRAAVSGLGIDAEPAPEER